MDGAQKLEVFLKSSFEITSNLTAVLKMKKNMHQIIINPRVPTLFDQ